MIVVAQISDLHVLGAGEQAPGRVDHNQRLSLAVQGINAEPIQPAAVIATGDLTNAGKPAQMSELKARLANLQAPLFAIPGNHDDQDQFREAFAMEWSSQDHLSWSIEIDELRILGLDVTVPGSDNAAFDESREQWLRDQLAASPEQPTAIAMHHPPFLTGISWMDNTAIRRRSEFANVIRDFDCVSRIFCGHIHRPVTANVGGATASVGLSTIYHVALDLEPGSPMQLVHDPAGYQLHCWIEGRWVSHTRYIDGATRPFRLER